jgi:hypothetical protein
MVISSADLVQRLPEMAVVCHPPHELAGPVIWWEARMRILILGCSRFVGRH